MSKEWGSRPSEILHIEDPLTAFYLDRAAYTFGTRLDNERDEIIHSSKKNQSAGQRKMALTMLMRKWLGGTQGQFASVLTKRG